MKQVSCRLRYWRGALIAIALAPLWAYGMGIELEPDDPYSPNDPCENAQDLTQPYTYNGVYGDLDYMDVDFFKFSRVPGERVLADLIGSIVPVDEWTDQYPLEDSYLGFFDSSCNLIAYDDNNGSGRNSRLVLTVPADGVVVLAASGCCDWNFDGSHWYSGNYTLTLGALPEPSSVSGRVVDAFTGDPLPGASVELRECWDSSCSLYDFVNWQVTDAQGEFLIDATYSGAPLAPGFYRVNVWAYEYHSGDSDVFELLEGQELDIGDITLIGPPVRFSDVNPCEYVPVIGGACEYSVTITNAEPQTLRGAAWSLVAASGTGSYVGYTDFPADGLERLILPLGESSEVEFEFDVPGTVPQGAYICPSVWVGLGVSEPYFFTLGRLEPMFCIQKGIADSYTLFTGAEAKAIFQQLKAQQNRKLPTRSGK